MNPIHPALARLARAAEHQDFAELEETLHVALRKPTWLRPEHRIGDPKGYMRHLLYIDPQDTFVITAITWLPGQVSGVHGHHVWCMYGVAEGELTEDQFSEDLAVTRTMVYRPGDLAGAGAPEARRHRVYGFRGHDLRQLDQERRGRGDGWTSRSHGVGGS